MFEITSLIQAAGDALTIVLSPERMGFILLGVAIGFVVGILPGLGGLVGMSLLITFIYGMDPFSAVGLLIGFVSVLHTVDTFPSVLLGVPGTSGAQATIMDGYPMSQAGRGATALGAAFFSSLVGGLVGATTLFLIILIARPLVQALNSPALFMLVLLGLAMVGVVSQGNKILGLLSGFMGLLLGTIGVAPGAAQIRYDYGPYLHEGLSLTIIALGLFAVPEMLKLLAKGESVAGEAAMTGRLSDGVRAAIKHRYLVLRSAIIGTGVGIVPGLGGQVVDWISYGIAKQTLPDTSGFGKGDIRGVIAPESANNAKEGGALVPALLFGIPGSGTTAVLLGGLLLLGFQAGPSMVEENLNVTLSIIWTLVLGNVFACVLCLAFAGKIAKLTQIPGQVFAPFLLVLIFLASYQTNRSWGDIAALVVMGSIGWTMFKHNWPRAPLLIGFVLSTGAERYLYRSMGVFGFGWLGQPAVIVIGLFTLFVLIGLGGRRRDPSEAKTATEQGA